MVVVQRFGVNCPITTTGTIKWSFGSQKKQHVAPALSEKTFIAFVFSFFSNRLFPSSKNSWFENEAKCKMSFVYMRIRNHLHINGIALSLKRRLGGARKWPTSVVNYPENSLLTGGNKIITFFQFVYSSKTNDQARIMWAEHSLRARQRGAIFFNSNISQSESVTTR